MEDTVGDTWEKKWKTKTDPYRDKISQSSEGHRQSSGRQRWRQSQIQVVTRSVTAVGDTVGEKVGDKVGGRVGHGKIIS